MSETSRPGQTSQFRLFTQRRFGPFFWTQFWGAFNDNVFKTALITILTYDAANWTRMDVGLLNNLIPGLFILPFVLFSATAGQLADKMEKSRLARYVKLMEIGIMLIAAAGWMTHQLWLLIAAIVGMGLHSTLFGPLKYAYLPQQLRRQELVGGNGIVEMGTFVGILLGEVLGASMVAQPGWGVSMVAAGTVLIAVIGWLSSRRIPLTPAAEPALSLSRNPIAETVRNLAFSRRNRTVFVAMLGNSWFWFYGAIMLAQFPLYAKDYLHGDHGVFVLLLTMFSLGIGAGSLMCERMSGRKLEIGLVPFGAIGLSLFGADLYLASAAFHPTGYFGASGFFLQAGSLRILFDCLLIGMFGGFYIVPLFALIQSRCDPKHVARTIAGMNVMNALFMVAAALAGMLMLKAGFTVPQIFMATAVLNGVVAVYLFSRMPDFPIRFAAWVLTHTVARTHAIDADCIPQNGPAILVCERGTLIKAAAIMTASSRPVRFVIDQNDVGFPPPAWILRAAKVIPIASAREYPELMEKTHADIAQTLQEGELVCIFPHEGLADAAGLGEFRGDIQKILERSQVPVIPMALRGL